MPVKKETPPCTRQDGASGNPWNLFRRDAGNRLENPAGDLVGISLGIRRVIFQVALVVAIHEAMRYADGCTTIGETVVNLIDRLCLMQTGQTHVIIGSVDGDVLVLVLV